MHRLPKIFINYRIEDSLDFTSRLADDLSYVFGADTVFRDRSYLQGGQHWRQDLELYARSCLIMLVIIGSGWVEVSSQRGSRTGYPRLSDPNDWVRREIQLALDSRVVVIPILLNDAERPSRAWLETCELQRLDDRQSLNIRADKYRNDFQELLETLVHHNPEWRSRVRLSRNHARHPVGRGWNQQALDERRSSPPRGIEKPKYALGLHLGSSWTTLTLCEVGINKMPTLVAGSPVPSLSCRGRQAFPLVGWQALYSTGAVGLDYAITFDPIEDPETWDTQRLRLRRFAEALFLLWQQANPGIASTDCIMSLGCPARWSGAARWTIESWFRESSVLPACQSESEDYAAFIQGLCTQTLAHVKLTDHTLIINLDDTRTDITVLDGGEESLLRRSDLGLHFVDEMLLEYVLERLPASHRPHDWQAVRFDALGFICRLARERSNGADHDILQIVKTHGIDPAVCNLLANVNTTDFFSHESAHRHSYIRQLEDLLVDAASRQSVPPTVVFLTGSGAHVDIVYQTVCKTLAPWRVFRCEEPATASGLGLATLARLGSDRRYLEDRILAFLGSAEAQANILPLYQAHVRDRVCFFTENATEAVWRPIADLWTQNKLHFKSAAELRALALDLLSTWAGEAGAPRLAVYEQALSESMTKIVAPEMRAVAADLGLPADALPLDVRLDPLAGIGSGVFDQLWWEAQFQVFFIVNQAPLSIRKLLGGRVLDLCLNLEQAMKSAMAQVMRHLDVDQGAFREAFDRAVVASIISALEEARISLFHQSLKQVGE